MSRRTVRIALFSALVAVAVAAGNWTGTRTTGAASWLDTFLGNTNTSSPSNPSAPPVVAAPQTRVTGGLPWLDGFLQGIIGVGTGLNPTPPGPQIDTTAPPMTTDLDTMFMTTSVIDGGGSVSSGAAHSARGCTSDADCEQGMVCQLGPMTNPSSSGGPQVTPFAAAAIPFDAGPGVTGPGGGGGTDGEKPPPKGIDAVDANAVPILGGGGAGQCVIGPNALACAVACLFNFSFTGIIGGGNIVLPPGCTCGSSSSSSSAGTCGNGLQDGAEECDDGNNISGDDCSADCKCEICEICQENEQKQNGLKPDELKQELNDTGESTPEAKPVSFLYRAIREILTYNDGFTAQATVPDSTEGVCCRLVANGLICSRDYTKGKCDDEAKQYRIADYPSQPFRFDFFKVNKSGNNGWWRCLGYPKNFPTEKDWQDAKDECHKHCKLRFPLCSAFRGEPQHTEGFMSFQPQRLENGNLQQAAGTIIADNLQSFLKLKNAPSDSMPQPKFTAVPENQCKKKAICCHIATNECRSEDIPSNGSTACPTSGGFASEVYGYSAAEHKRCTDQCKVKNTASKQGVLCDPNNRDKAGNPKSGPPTCTVADLMKKPDGTIDYDFYYREGLTIFPIDPNPSSGGTTNQQQLMTMCKDWCAKDVTCMTKGWKSPLSGLHDRPVCTTFYGSATVNKYANYCNDPPDNWPIIYEKKALHPKPFDKPFDGWEACYDAAAKYGYCVTEYDLPGYGVKPRCETIYDAQKNAPVTMDLAKCKGGNVYATLSECLEAANPTPPPPPKEKKFICCRNADTTTYPSCNDCTEAESKTMKSWEYDPDKPEDRGFKVADCQRNCPAKANAVCTNQHRPACDAGTCRPATANGRVYKCLTCTPRGASCSDHSDCCGQGMACDYMWRTCTPARGAPCTRDGIGCPDGYRCGLALRCE